jgi:hypothetical protein
MRTCNLFIRLRIESAASCCEHRIAIFRKCFVYLSNVIDIFLSVTSTQLADACPLLTKLEACVSFNVFKTNVHNGSMTIH